MAELKNLIVEGDTRLIGDTNAGKVTATSFVKSGGTSSQFLKADGSVDSNTYSQSSHTHSTNITGSTATNQITLAASTKYSLSAGGTSFVFTTPPNTNTHRTIQLNGTQILGDNTTPFNIRRTNGINITNLGSGAIRFEPAPWQYIYDDRPSPDHWSQRFIGESTSSVITQVGLYGGCDSEEFPVYHFTTMVGDDNYASERVFFYAKPLSSSRIELVWLFTDNDGIIVCSKVAVLNCSVTTYYGCDCDCEDCECDCEEECCDECCDDCDCADEPSEECCEELAECDCECETVIEPEEVPPILEEPLEPIDCEEQVEEIIEEPVEIVEEGVLPNLDYVSKTFLCEVGDWLVYTVLKTSVEEEGSPSIISYAEEDSVRVGNNWYAAYRLPSGYYILGVNNAEYNQIRSEGGLSSEQLGNNRYVVVVEALQEEVEEECPEEEELIVP